MLKKLIILAGLLLTSVTAHATVISHFGYERDSASNIVTGGGLEWLKWDVTKGMSINSALSTYKAQGWRLASNVEMAALFNKFQFGADVFTGVEGTLQTTTYPWSPSEDSNYNLFYNLFGLTYENTNVCTITRPTSCYVKEDNYVGVAALYGSDDNRDRMYKRANVYDDKTWRSNIQTDVIQAQAYLTNDYKPVNDASPSVGVALVRTFDTNPVTVPTPGSIGLLALGLVALGYRRRPVLAR